MDTIELLGHTISLADVYQTVVPWVMPVFFGVAASVYVNYMKKLGMFGVLENYAPQLKVLATRVFVALVCVGVNVLAAYVGKKGMTVDVIADMFVSYFAAVVKFEHSQKAVSAS